MKRFLAALRFLTILPVPGGQDESPDDLAGTPVYFPLVGVLIGLAAAGLASGLLHVLPMLPGSVVLVIALIGVSGGLHLDGLSDTADGFFSSRPRERILEIMRDSRVGAMGVMAIVCVLLLKVTSLASVPGGAFLPVAFLMPVAGRCALVISMSLLPYARPEGGLGTAFYRSRPVLGSVWAALVLLVAGWLVCGFGGLAAAGASLIVVLLFAAYTHRKLGGATGDTLGAACEIGETIPPLALAIWHFCAA